MARYVRVVSAQLLIKANAKILADREKHGLADVASSIVSGFAHEHHSEELLAVSHRLMALARLIGTGKVEQWTKNVKDWRLLDEALFRAAARAPLQEGKMLRDMKFDPQEFLQIALEEVGSEGSA